MLFQTELPWEREMALSFNFSLQCECFIFQWIFRVDTRSSMAGYIERDECCLFVGNLDSRVTEEILWELFLQVRIYYQPGSGLTTVSEEGSVKIIFLLHL